MRQFGGSALSSTQRSALRVERYFGPIWHSWTRWFSLLELLGGDIVSHGVRLRLCPTVAFPEYVLFGRNRRPGATGYPPASAYLSGRLSSPDQLPYTTLTALDGSTGALYL